MERAWVRWLVVFGICTMLGLIDAVQAYMYHEAHNDPIPAGVALLLGVSDWYTWAILTPIIVWSARRFPLGHCSAVRLAMHGLASIVSSLLVVGICVGFIRMLTPLYAPRSTAGPWDVFRSLLNLKIIFYVLIHWLILGATHGILYYRKYRDRERQALRLEGELARAQLAVLKMQLHPHFLFNTLHAISALVHRDANLADRMIASLGEMLRNTLDNADRQEVTLREELDFIQPYLEIEQARLGPRLSVQIDADPSTLDALVPNLLLQPLVENAVRHGIAPQSGPGVVEVRAIREGDRLRIDVRDTGRGLPGGAVEEGVGLSNTRARLRHLYGDDQSLQLSMGEVCGVVVTVVLPFREGVPRFVELEAERPDALSAVPAPVRAFPHDADKDAHRR